MKTPQAHQTQYLQTVSRAVAVLRAFKGGRRDMSLKELTNELNLNKVTTFRLARTLANEGLLIQDPSNDRYALSFGCLALVDGMLDRNGLAEISRKHLRKARDETGETATVLVREGWDRVVIATEPSFQPVRYVMEVGRRNRLYLSGSGACLASGLNEDELEALIAFMENDPVSHQYGLTKDVLLARLAFIRKNGWGTAQGEWAEEAAGVAAPIYSQDGTVIATIAIAMPRSRYTEAYRDKCAPAAIEVATLIGKEYDAINR
ncbi:MAG: IclR family transcriptional regulator [Sneathiella sp.]|nr:IclR family transcriptional regulator [Sneathiella sp.]